MTQINHQLLLRATFTQKSHDVTLDSLTVIISINKLWRIEPKRSYTSKKYSTWLRENVWYCNDSTHISYYSIVRQDPFTLLGFAMLIRLINRACFTGRVRLTRKFSVAYRTRQKRAVINCCHVCNPELFTPRYPHLLDYNISLPSGV